MTQLSRTGDSTQNPSSQNEALPGATPFCNVQPTSVVPSAAAWEAVAMGKHRIKPNYRRRVLRLPDLDHLQIGSAQQSRLASLALILVARDPAVECWTVLR
jgi:hypothetical protein